MILLIIYLVGLIISSIIMPLLIPFDEKKETPREYRIGNILRVLFWPFLLLLMCLMMLVSVITIVCVYWVKYVKQIMNKYD